MHDDARIDDEFAAWTDELLAGNDTQAAAEWAELTSVVRQLHEIVAPDRQPDPAFRDQLTRRLNREWNFQHQRRSRVWQNRRVIQIAALAASVTVVLLAIVLVLSQASENGETVQGTAVGSAPWAIAVVVAIVGGIGLVLVWYRRRH